MEVVKFTLADQLLRDRYDRLFEACPNGFIQQSTYWAEIIKDLGTDQPIFLLCQDRGEDIAGLPLYLYQHALGNILTSVPYPGPLGGVFFRDELSEVDINSAYASLLEAAVQLARETHCIALTIITNPFFQDLELYQRYLLPTFVLENFTQYIPLSEMIADGVILSPNYNRHSNVSRNLRKARAANFSVAWCETQAEMETWYSIHEQRHRELGVMPLSWKLFQNIWRVLKPRQKAQLLLIKKDDDLVFGCLYVRHRHVVDVFMPSMKAEYAKDGPSFLATEHSLLWAHRAGARIYNWQSSPSRESGVYRYKKQWNSIEIPYYFVTRLFCDPERIQRMGSETIKKEYSWHYVVPYAAFEQGFDQKYFEK